MDQITILVLNDAGNDHLTLHFISGLLVFVSYYQPNCFGLLLLTSNLSPYSTLPYTTQKGRQCYQLADKHRIYQGMVGTKTELKWLNTYLPGGKNQNSDKCKCCSMSAGWENRQFVYKCLCHGILSKMFGGPPSPLITSLYSMYNFDQILV